MLGGYFSVLYSGYFGAYSVRVGLVLGGAKGWGFFCLVARD